MRSLFSVLLLVALPAMALEWQNTPTVSLVSTGNDNFRLTTTDIRDVGSSRVDASTTLTGRSERLQFMLRPRVYGINYNDDREFDRTNSFLDTSLSIGNARRQWNLSAGFSRDGTLANAFEESGFLVVDADRDRVNAGLGFSALVTERGSFGIQLAAQEISYERLLLGPLVDYDYASVALTYVHAVNERSDFEVEVYGTKLDTQQTFGETRNSGIDLSFTRELSDTLDFRIGAGRYQSRRPGVASQSAGADTAFDLSLGKRWSRLQARVALSAKLEPSAFGVLWRREAASVNFTRQFAERIDAGLALNFGRVRSNEPQLVFEDRRYASVQIQVNWHVAERLSFAASLGRRGQEYVSQLDAEGTYGQVSFTYRGRGA